MKQPKLLLAALMLSSLSSVFAQRPVDPSNCREGETVEYCRSHVKMAELMKNPAFLKINAADQAILKQAEEDLLNQKSGAQGQVYTIPLVFHVLHNGGSENISREQILDAVDILNRDYRLQNSDANNVVSAFQGLPADAEIEFTLATIAPNGQCFSGITRTVSPLTHDGSNGGAQVNAIANGNDVYQGTWPGDEYLNIFVVNEADGAAGYTTTPSNWMGAAMSNGIWILHNYVGSIGTSSNYTSRSLTHEVGHWLNLEHPWGGTNNPGIASNCSSDDGVNDTPNTIGVTSCNLTESSCGPLANVENYMDYSYCSKMFTPGQVTRMRAALNSSVGGRNNIWQTSNLNAVGANGNAPLCEASFTSDRVIICAGETVTFTDESYHNVTGRTWTFTGGSPASSTSDVETVTYSTPGNYTVALQATDGSNTVSTTENAYITVLPATGYAPPVVEGFESITVPSSDWFIENPDNSTTFVVSSLAAATGSKSLRLNNYSNQEGDVDAIVSNTYDLSGLSQVTMTFKYAFAQRNSSNTDKLQVLVSNTCGESWSVRKNISATQIATASTTNGNFTPSASDWETVTITNITSSYLVENFRFKFEFTAGGGNNLYIDDINIFDPNSNVSVEELDVMTDLSIYPNPANNMVNISFNLLEEMENGSIEITDMLGKRVSSIYKGSIQKGMQQYAVPVNELSKGIYFVNIASGTTNVSRKLIIE